MSVLDASIIIFIVLELLNVIILYFSPEFKYGNGVATFKEWEKGKEDENRYLFNRYMAKWVANSKLIFIALLGVILFKGTEEIKIYAVIATIISIAVYYITLHPIVKKLDEKEMLTKKGYSKTLFLMITGFLVMFLLALFVQLFL